MRRRTILNGAFYALLLVFSGLGWWIAIVSRVRLWDERNLLTSDLYAFELIDRKMRQGKYELAGQLSIDRERTIIEYVLRTGIIHEHLTMAIGAAELRSHLGESEFGPNGENAIFPPEKSGLYEKLSNYLCIANPVCEGDSFSAFLSRLEAMCFRERFWYVPLKYYDKSGREIPESQQFQVLMRDIAGKSGDRPLDDDQGARK